MPHKTDHLQLHGRHYRVRIAVPADLRKEFGGKAFLIASLGTSDLTEADRCKGEHVSRFKGMIAQARGPKQTKTTSQRPGQCSQNMRPINTGDGGKS